MNLNIENTPLTYSYCYSSFTPEGHLLADDFRGETPVIPEQLIRYSQLESQHVNTDITLKVLGSIHDDPSSIPGHEKADKVIR